MLPDILAIEFIRPDLVLQEFSLEKLEDGNAKTSVLLTPQYTQERYDELVSLNAAAEGVSWFFILCEFLLLFFAGKALLQMWSMLLTAQFIAYMHSWQSDINGVTGIVLQNLKVVALNEAFDKVKQTANVSQFLGLDNHEYDEDGVTQ